MFVFLRTFKYYCSFSAIKSISLTVHYCSIWLQKAFVLGACFGLQSTRFIIREQHRCAVRSFRARVLLSVIARYATNNAGLTISLRVGPGFQSALECAKDEKEREASARVRSAARHVSGRFSFERGICIRAPSRSIMHVEKQKGHVKRRFDDDEQPAEQWTRPIAAPGDCGRTLCAPSWHSTRLRFELDVKNDRFCFVSRARRITLNLAGASLKLFLLLTVAALSFLCRTQLTGRNSGEKTRIQ